MHHPFLDSPRECECRASDDHTFEKIFPLHPVHSRSFCTASVQIEILRPIASSTSNPMDLKHLANEYNVSKPLIPSSQEPTPVIAPSFMFWSVLLFEIPSLACTIFSLIGAYRMGSVNNSFTLTPSICRIWWFADCEVYGAISVFLAWGIDRASHSRLPSVTTVAHPTPTIPPSLPSTHHPRTHAKASQDGLSADISDVLIIYDSISSTAARRHPTRERIESVRFRHRIASVSDVHIP